MRFKSISVISVSDTCRLINAELLYFFSPVGTEIWGLYDREVVRMGLYDREVVLCG